MNGGKFFSRSHWLAFWVTYAVVQLVYLFSLAPTVTVEDSGELITAAANLGVPHPPGYPLWTMVTWLFIKLVPFGNIAWRANLCSSVLAAFSCGIIALITAFLAERFSEAPAIKKNLPQDAAPGFLAFTAGSLAGMSLGFIESLWFQSVITEVYSLNALMFALILLCMLRWLYEPQRLFWGFLTILFYGLGLTSHQTLLFFSPALLIFMAFVNWRVLRDLLPYVLMAASTISWCTRNTFVILVTGFLYVVYVGMLIYSSEGNYTIDQILFLIVSSLLPGLAGYLAAECVNDVSSFSTLTNLIEFRWAMLMLIFCFWVQLLLSFFGSSRVLVPYALALAIGTSMSSQNEYAIGLAITLGGILVAQKVIPNRRSFGVRQAGWLVVSLLMPFLGGFAIALCVGREWEFPYAWVIQIPFFAGLGSHGIWIASFCVIGVIGIVMLPIAASIRGVSLWNGKSALLLILAGILGVSVYAYLPFSAKTNPPMNWSYTGTVSGFVHSVTRGQYDAIKEARDAKDFFKQIEFYYTNLVSNYTLPVALLAILALIGIFDCNTTEKKYSVTLLVGWMFLSLVLTYVANTTFEEQTLFIVRVFFASSFVIFSIWVGLGMVILFSLINQIRTIQSWLIALVFLMVLMLLAVGFDSPFVVYPKMLFFVFSFIIFIWCSFQFHTLRMGRYMAVFFIPVMLIAVNGWKNDWRPWGSDQRGHDFGWKFGYDMLKNMDRDAVVFGGTDPGRFIPTYMIFVESFAKPENKYYKGRDFDRRDLYIITQNALADGTYMDYIRDHYTTSRPTQYNFFERWLGRDKTYPKEVIQIPNADQYSQIFGEVCDRLGRQPGSGVTVLKDEQGVQRVGAEGINAIFAINGAIAREIFEHNKDKHTFYVEESIPIDWMYPYLEPFGLIMKLNKEPIPKIPEAVVKKDMDFWNHYTNQLLSDPKFLEDIVARRAFAKLRSSIGGLYVYRGMKDEAEIALQQAISLFGASSEACTRLIELYVRQEKYDEARHVALNWIDHDPDNRAVIDVLTNIELITQMAMNRVPLMIRFQSNPADSQTFFELTAVLANLQKYNELDEVMLRYLKNKQLDSAVLQRAVSLYQNFKLTDRLEKVLETSLKSDPNNYQIWYNLAIAQTLNNKAEDALKSLKKAVALNANLKKYALDDPRLQGLRVSPDFQKITQ